MIPLCFFSFILEGRLVEIYFGMQSRLYVLSATRMHTAVRSLSIKIQVIYFRARVLPCSKLEEEGCQITKALST
jgi:hypothetical protein